MGEKDRKRDKATNAALIGDSEKVHESYIMVDDGWLARGWPSNLITPSRRLIILLISLCSCDLRVRAALYFGSVRYWWSQLRTMFSSTSSNNRKIRQRRNTENIESNEPRSSTQNTIQIILQRKSWLPEGVKSVISVEHAEFSVIWSLGALNNTTIRRDKAKLTSSWNVSAHFWAAKKGFEHRVESCRGGPDNALYHPASRSFCNPQHCLLTTVTYRSSLVPEVMKFPVSSACPTRQQCNPLNRLLYWPDLFRQIE